MHGVCSDESKNLRMLTQLWQSYLVVSQGDKMKKWWNILWKSNICNSKNEAHLVVIYPQNTHDLITVGFPIPVHNPKHGWASKQPYGWKKTPSVYICMWVHMTPDSKNGMLLTLTYSVQVLSVVISIFKPFASFQLSPDRFLRHETTWYVDKSYGKMA